MNLRKFPEINLNNYKVQDSMGFGSNVNSIIYPPKSLISYYSYNNQLAKKKIGKLFELIFFGLNYNAKRIKHFRKPWVLDLQKSHKIKVTETRNSTIRTKIFKRRVLFFSYDIQRVTELTKLLKKQRSQNSYSGHGLILRNDHYLTKPGKIRQK